MNGTAVSIVSICMLIIPVCSSGAPSTLLAATFPADMARAGLPGTSTAVHVYLWKSRGIYVKVGEMGSRGGELGVLYNLSFFSSSSSFFLGGSWKGGGKYDTETCRECNQDMCCTPGNAEGERPLSPPPNSPVQLQTAFIHWNHPVIQPWIFRWGCVRQWMNGQWLWSSFGNSKGAFH